MTWENITTIDLGTARSQDSVQRQRETIMLSWVSFNYDKGHAVCSTPLASMLSHGLDLTMRFMHNITFRTCSLWFYVASILIMSNARLRWVNSNGASWGPKTPREECSILCRICEEVVRPVVTEHTPDEQGYQNLGKACEQKKPCLP